MASHEFRYENIQANAESRLHLGNQTTTNNHYYSPSPIPAEHLSRPPISSGVQTDFLRACHQGQRRRLEHLLSKGADVEGVDSQNCTPLHYAALGGSVQTVEFLIAQGVDINAVSTWYGSPLCLAALKGHIAVVEALLTEGALVNLSCKFLGSAAHATCVGGDVPTLQALGARGADFKAQRTTCIEAWEDLLALEENSLLELRDRPLDKCLQIHRGSPGALAVQFGFHRVVDYCLNELVCLSVHETLSLSHEWTKESLLGPQTVPVSHWGNDTLIMSVSSKVDDRMMRVLLPHDPAFKLQPNPKEFFTMGTVFSALRPKTASGADSNALLALPRSGNNEAITSEVRRFVVICERDDAVSCSCVPIIAHDEAPLSQSEHAIVYTGSEIPNPAQENALVVWDHNTMLKPIRIDPYTPSDVLRPMSRLNFGDISVVQHSARVRPFGKVHSSAVADVIHHFSGVWARIIKRMQELIPRPADCVQVTSPSSGGQLAILPRRQILRISDESDSDSASDASFSALVPGHYRQSTLSDNIRKDESLYRFFSKRRFLLSKCHISRIEKFSKRYRCSIVEDGRSDTLPSNSFTGHHDWATRPYIKSHALDALPDAKQSLYHGIKELVVFRDSVKDPLGQRERNGANSAVSVETILVAIDSAIVHSARSSGRMNSTSRFAAPAVPHTLAEELHTVCKGLEEHDAIFSMLPAGVECASVFYESMEWIVASSLRNLYKATTLLKILTKLNATVTGVVKNFKLYPQARRQIKQIAMELYTCVFELLTKVVRCFDRKPLLWWSEQRAYADCESALQDICDWLEIANSTVLNGVVLELRNARKEDRITREEELNSQARFKEDIRNIAENCYELQKTRDLQLAVQQDQLKLLSSEVYQESFANVLMSKFAQRLETDLVE